MNEIKIFNNPQFGDIRTATNEDSEPIFCLVDICKILDIKNVGNCKARLSEKGIHTADTLTNGGIQQMIFISEPNLYKVIFQSRKPEAEQFTEWVTSEVLPSIRKTGGYIQTSENDTPELIMARALLMADDTIKRLNQTTLNQQKTINNLLPKAALMNLVIDADEKIDIGQASKILELPFGRNTFFKKLREMGVFFKARNEPKQIYIDRGFFQLKEKYITRNEHDGFVVIKVLVTQKGLAFLSEQFKSGRSNKTLAIIQ